MDTLLNASMPSDGHEPSSGGAPVGTPSTGSKMNEYGVSIENILNGTFLCVKGCSWYVLRATYGRAIHAAEYIAEQHTLNPADESFALTYVPRTVNSVVKGERKIDTTVSRTGGLFFVYTKEETIKKIVEEPIRKTGKLRSDVSPVIQISLMKIQEDECRKTVVVPHYQMVNFIRLMSVDDPYVGFVDVSNINIRKNQYYRVIGGNFEGVIGRVARIKSQTVLLVDMTGLGFAKTSHVPKWQLEECDPPADETK